MTKSDQNQTKTRSKSIRLKHNLPFEPRWGNDPGKLFATPNLLIRGEKSLVIPTKIPIIAHTIPPSPDYSPASPDYSPASLDYSPASDTKSDPSEDPSSDHISPLLDISPFLSSADDTTYSDTPDTPPSPTHIHMMTVRKRVGPLHVQQFAVRHSADHYSSNYFSLDDSARHSSSDSSSETSSYFHSDALSNSSSRHSLSDHSSPDLLSTSTGLSRKRRRDSGYLADVEVDPRETSLRDDVMIRGSDEPHLEQDIDLEIQAEIDECFAYVDALRDRGIDARVVVEAVDREESEMGTRAPVEVRVERVTLPIMLEDTPEPAQEERDIKCIYETLGSMGRRIVGVESAVTALTERIAELERDNMRLRDTASVESQRVDRLQHGMSRMQRELRRMRRFWFYDRVRVRRFEGKIPNTRSGASITHEEVKELVARRVAEEMEVHEAAMNLEPLNENGDEQESENGGNRNRGNRGNENEGNRDGGNGENGDGGNVGNENGGNKDGGNRENKNGNRNRNHGMNYRGFMPVAQECTFQDFLKCKPHNFSGPEGVGYAARSAKNKRRMESNLRDNRGQQPPFKRQNISGQNVARAYAAGNNEKRGRDCPKLKGQNRRNQTRNRVGNKTRNQTGGNKATARAYAIGGGGTHPDSNVFTGMFLLNNCHASMLFNSGSDRSFVSSTFSTLLDVASSTFDNSYAIELTDGRISETNVVLRGCTLGLLGDPFDIDLMP
nr:reverse transcriptase domain-containing protein [Tanacetum cinerariifolium]